MIQIVLGHQDGIFHLVSGGGGQNRGEPNSGGECRGYHPVKDTRLFYHNPENYNLIMTSPEEIQ